jgi:hypothetical protein
MMGVIVVKVFHILLAAVSMIAAPSALAQKPTLE